MPEPRTLEEWAVYCGDEAHSQNPEWVIKQLCVDCARAYAEKLVEEKREAAIVAAAYTCHQACITFDSLLEKDQHRRDFEALRAENDRLKAENVALHRERKGEVWYWQGDGYDSPESLTCPVLLEAEKIRALLVDHAKLLAGQRLLARAVACLWDAPLGNEGKRWLEEASAWLAALPESVKEETMEWQPIETAPRDVKVLADRLWGNQSGKLRTLRAENERLKAALHDAEAIGDFPAELRDRLFLKETAEAKLREIDELKGERDQLTCVIEGLLNVVHDYLPHHRQVCLRFIDDGIAPRRTCRNTGASPMCELCGAREALAALPESVKDV